VDQEFSRSTAGRRRPVSPISGFGRIFPTSDWSPAPSPAPVDCHDHLAARLHSRKRSCRRAVTGQHPYGDIPIVGDELTTQSHARSWRDRRWFCIGNRALLHAPASALLSATSASSTKPRRTIAFAFRPSPERASPVADKRSSGLSTSGDRLPRIRWRVAKESRDGLRQTTSLNLSTLIVRSWISRDKLS
jgi:hypothetical protein